MNETRPGAAAPPDAVDQTDPAQTLLQDWITIWQSEAAALATDREGIETLQALLALSAAAATPRPGPRTAADATDRPSGSAAPAGPSPAAVAPDPRDAEIERLVRRVAELERRPEPGGAEPVRKRRRR